MVEKMNPVVKEKWIAALESGEYKQGIDGLREDLVDESCRYCCLGVLTDLYAKEKGITFEEAGSHEDRKAYLSDQVRLWSGVTDRGYLPDEPHSLACLNDTGYNFKEIAGIIRGRL